MTRRGVLFVVAVIAVRCAAPAPPTAPAPVVNTPAPLAPPTGRVIEYGTLAPVGGAVVSFYSYEALWTAGASKDPIASVVTNAQGGYHVDLPPLMYTVAVDGVQLASLTLRPEAPHGDFIVRNGNCSAGYGFVTDAATGAPLADAVVTVLGRRATTSARGWYLLEFGCNLPMGGNTTAIDFAREGYATKRSIYGRGVRGLHRFDAALSRQ